MSIPAGTKCWIPDENHGFVQGITIDSIVPGQAGRVQLAKTQTEMALLPAISKGLEKREDVESPPTDLSTLPYLSKSSILDATRGRFRENHVYTSVGPLLLSINPFKSLPELYSPETQGEYFRAALNSSAAVGSLDPHLYQVACKAFFAATKKTNQSIVFSGESGAGKTMASRLLVEFLVFCSAQSKTDVVATALQDDNNNMHAKLLSVMPLIEAFGNAQTLRNDNSSRFGCWTEIQFSQASISGVKLRGFNLEKSRVVAAGNRGQNQRNFHIFYQYTASLQEDNVTEYYYLNDSASVPADAENFKSTLQLLGKLDLDPTRILQVVRAVLEIGNISFNSADNESVTINSCLEHVCKCLGVEHETTLSRALLQRELSNAKEVVYSPNSKAQAEACRDALAKHLYGRLFDWLLNQINQVTNHSQVDAEGFVAVLDMYGFETFDQDVNSLEQLCINYCNERLLEAFNEKYIHQERDLYVSEGIATNLEFVPRERLVLDFLEASPYGFFNLLDEECVIPKGSDMGLLERLRKVHQTNGSKCFLPHIPNKEYLFAISHFASVVRYSVRGFVEKNRDTLPNCLERVLEESKGFIGDELFPTANSTTKAISGTRRHQKVSICSKFKNELKELMNRMDSTDKHFVRCIKPNGNAAGDEFNGKMVLNQLSNSGVLETCKLRQTHGFELRQTHAEFLARYARCCLSSTTEGGIEDLVESLNGQEGIKVQLGKTLVFVNTQDVVKLDALEAKTNEASTVKIQALIRRRREQKIHAKRTEYLIQLDSELKQEVRSFAVLDTLLRGPQLLLFPDPDCVPLIKLAKEVHSTLESDWNWTINALEKAIEEGNVDELQNRIQNVPRVRPGSPRARQLSLLVKRAQHKMNELQSMQAIVILQRSVRTYLFRVKVERAFATLEASKEKSDVEAALLCLSRLGLAQHPLVLQARENLTSGKINKQTKVDLKKLACMVLVARIRLTEHRERNRKKRVVLTQMDVDMLDAEIEIAKSHGATYRELREARSVKALMEAALNEKHVSWWKQMLSCTSCSTQSPVVVPPPHATIVEFDDEE